MPVDLNMRVTRVRLFEVGHSMEEIDNMGLQDIGDVLGYWTGKGKGEEKLAKRR